MELKEVMIILLIVMVIQFFIGFCCGVGLSTIIDRSR
jgi:hypothetical protein